MEGTPNLPPCPLAYEVLAPSTRIKAIRAKIDATGQRMGVLIDEPGDVSRFTVFLRPVGGDSVDIHGIAEAVGGRALHVEPQSAGEICAPSNLAILLAKSEPKSLVVAISSANLVKLEQDLERAALSYKIFTSFDDQKIVNLALPSGLSDYKFLSVSFRLTRGDYGEVSFGPIISLSDLKKMNEKAERVGQP